MSEKSKADVLREKLCYAPKNAFKTLSAEEIANAEMSMPEILIDEINDIATQYIGDILIDTFDAEMSVLEQYVNELKEAMK